jgi:phosphate transport system permease protein
MTDASIPSTAGSIRKYDWTSEVHARRLKRRYAADRRLQFYGLAAIAIALSLLAVLVISLIASGYTSFYQTKATLQVELDASIIDANDPGAASYRRIVSATLERYFPDVEGRAERRALASIFTSQMDYIIRSYAVANPDRIGQTVPIAIPLSDPFDQLEKGVIPRRVDALSITETERFEYLVERGFIAGQGADARLQLDLTITPELVDPANIEAGTFQQIIVNALDQVGSETDPGRRFTSILRKDAADLLKAHVAANPQVIGTVIENFGLPLAEHYATLAAGETPTVINPRFAGENQFAWLDRLKAQGAISYPFSTELFTNADSRFPELAGLAGALTGAFYTMLICFLLSFPVGIAAAVYLEEFAPKNRWTDVIEVNINNLAAVPSVVFGLLGLAVFIGFFGLPRSAPLVGGMVLSLMTLPTIIIATRASLKGVPPSIREAALGVGASKHQVVMHHVLPLAMPGILTGTIIGLAQALGETAPLLLIGMNAFIPSVDNMGLLEPATSLPTQIFSWADSPERGFVARTSAAILVLLGFLVIMNAIAIFLRQYFQRKW